MFISFFFIFLSLGFTMFVIHQLACVFSLSSLNNVLVKNYLVLLKVEGRPMEFEVDTVAFHLDQGKTLDDVLLTHEVVLDPGMSRHKEPSVNLDLKEDAALRFLKASPVPFAMCTAVEAELRMLQSQGTRNTERG